MEHGRLVRVSANWERKNIRFAAGFACGGGSTKCVLRENSIWIRAISDNREQAGLSDRITNRNGSSSERVAALKSKVAARERFLTIMRRTIYQSGVQYRSLLLVGTEKSPCAIDGSTGETLRRRKDVPWTKLTWRQCPALIWFYSVSKR
jgi:hypothetical protein